MTGTVKLVSAGGGSVSLATPSTSSNRTLTLPDADVNQLSDATLTTQGDTLYRDGSGLQRLAKGTAGQYLKMNSGATAPEWAAVTGGVLQVKRTSRDTVAASGHASTTYVDVNSVTITPAAASSSFLVCYTVRAYLNANGDNASSAKLVRNVNGGSFSDLREQNAILVDQDTDARSDSATIWYTDTPSYSAGQALIYKSQQNRAHGSASINIGQFTDLVVIELANGILT